MVVQQAIGSGVETLSKSAGFDLDDSVDKAWRGFRRALADRIVGLEVGESFYVEVETPNGEEEPGCAPYVQVIRFDEDGLRGEVSGNRYLRASSRLDKATRCRLVDLGWARPDKQRDQYNFALEVAASGVDQLAVMAVTALREVFAVTHPAFLACDVVVEPDVDLPTVASMASTGEAVAVRPVGRDHLVQLVDAALTDFLGQCPVRDEDGDVPIVSGSAVVFVRVPEHHPMVEIFAPLVLEATDLDSARFEVAVLNRDRPFAKFLLLDDQIMMTFQLPAWPFLADQLRAMLAMMCTLADEVDADLAARVGGRCFFEPSAGQDPVNTDEVVHPAMLTLLQLDAESPGALDAATAAHICDYDRDLLLDQIRWNEEQELSWREARDEARSTGDPDDEADVCEHERAHARRMTKLLRKTLRLVVQRQKSDRR